MQTAAEQSRSPPSLPPEHPDDDLDLPEAFAYGDDDILDQAQSAHVDDVRADFGFLDRAREPDLDLAAGHGGNGNAKWTDFTPAENGTESRPARVPTKSANNEYVAC